MSVNPVIAAGLLDNPWVVVTILIVSALANWLSKRRADNAGKNPPAETDAPDPDPPAAGQNWEESFRRMFEVDSQEQSSTPAQPAQPPPLIRRPPNLGRVSVPPLVAPLESQSEPALRPASVGILPVDEFESGETPVRRYELSRAAHAAQARQASHRFLQSKATRPRLFLHHPHTARQAFVASLVFGQPKGLEN